MGNRSAKSGGIGQNGGGPRSDYLSGMRFGRVFLWLAWFCSVSSLLAGTLDDFIADARSRHGEAGERAARFLVANMPEKDRNQLSKEFLLENLDLAFSARSEFPWARTVPEDIFLNDVLPYAVFDESRDPWRAEFLERARTIVKSAKTASDAAQELNRQWFNLIKVHYNTGRKRPNQSYKESRELGKATCTGLSIILVEACRAVGIPARSVGTPMWTNERGNHTWVEIWDGDWKFTGADEYDAGGLNRGWFVGDAAQARADSPRYSIYATSWKREGVFFPMVWARNQETVAAVNVTSRYAKTASDSSATATSRLGIRLLESPGGNRMIARVSAVDLTGHPLGVVETKAGRADLNDLATLELPPGTQGWLRFNTHGESREMAFGPIIPGNPIVETAWTLLPATPPTIVALENWLRLPAQNRRSQDPVLQAALSRSEAERALTLLSADRLRSLATERAEEFEKRVITRDGKSLRWDERVFGDAPVSGHSLWISMHGGGNAPAAVNDRQWQNQIKLYEPTEGIYVAPRAPTDTWNLWHENHIDPLFQELIEDYVALRGVDPNRVYLMGYSAGGDGVWQLAPRMADRFAAAAMMAGHPNEASLNGLRDLPFAIFMGGDDGAYNRNKVAAERTAELDRLEKADPGGYVHMSRIYPGLGHWMNRKDAEALPWMAQFQRQAWPRKIVWEQDDVVHHRFYWLTIPNTAALKERARILASVENQTIQISNDVPAGMSLRLSDALLDLDQPFRVVVNGREVFSGRAQRQAQVILESLRERADPTAAATATVRWD